MGQGGTRQITPLFVVKQGYKIVVVTRGFPYTIPLRNSSSGYFVPRHTIPSFQRVWNMERISVYMNKLVLTGCRKK
jgi:hypothetical protein